MAGSQTVTGFGPGKVILLGEHGVVYGYPALAAPLSVGVTAHASFAKRPKLEVPEAVRGEARKLLLAAFDAAVKAAGSPPVHVSLRSDLPPSMGLGSSAAVSVACARVLLQAASGKAPSGKEVAHIAWQMERVFHGTPSGVDHTTSALNAPIHFRRRPDADRASVKEVDCPATLKLLVLLVGQRPSTKQTVAALRARQAKWPERYARIFDEIGHLADEGREAVEEGDPELLGDLMNMNHGLLAALGLSSASIDDAVHLLRAQGAFGAKLTGAGGDGGAVIALFEDADAVRRRLRKKGYTCFTSQIAGPRTLL